MSEAIQSHLEESLFSGIDSLYMDPKVKRIFDKVNTYNALLATERVTDEEIQAIVAEIDGEWDTVVGTQARFTGIAEFPDLRDENQRFLREFHEDETVIFRGLFARPPQLAPDEDPQGRYLLRIGMQKEVIDPFGERIILGGYASLEDVGTLDFPHAMSTERARWILQELQSELIEGIDCALLNEAQDEGETALRLAGLEYEPIADQETNQLIMSALQVYTNSLIRFDRQNGYDFGVDGFVWLTLGDGDAEVELTKGGGLATVEQVVWGNSPVSSGTIVPHLDMRICKLELTDTTELMQLFAPASELTKLQPVRRLFLTIIGE